MLPDMPDDGSGFGKGGAFDAIMDRPGSGAEAEVLAEDWKIATTQAAAAANASPSSAAITTIQTTEAVTVNASGCAQKASFSWDLPIEPISCLGNVISTGSEFFGNPPGSASINAEGTTAPETVTQIDIGNFTFNLGAGASLASRSNNLAVGQMHGTFNSVTDGLAINATFADS